MPKAPETRKYNLSDADLKQTADAAAACIVRDGSAFLIRGVTTTTLAVFATMREEFDFNATDDEFLGLVTTATETKNGLRKQLEQQVRSIRAIATDKYQGKGHYRLFGFDGLTQQTDNDLYRLGRRVYRVAGEYATELEPHGLITGVLDTLSTTLDSYDNAIDEVDKFIKLRDFNTQDRIVRGNALYKEMMRLCAIGKAIYQDTDEAKYNDYVVLSTPPVAPPAPVAPAPPVTEPNPAI